MSLKKFIHTDLFYLESGKKLPALEIAYHTFGNRSTYKNNIVWVCHALTANSDVIDWWPGLFGEKAIFNPEEHFIICANIVGSAYGTTNPLSIDAKNDEPYYLSFPEITIRDMVKAHQLLAAHLKIDQIDVLIGGSLGGQQALEWAVSEPEKINQLIILASNARHSPWGIAFNESQRLCLTADPTFYKSQPNGGNAGLKAARSLALLSYRSYKTYAVTQSEDDLQKKGSFNAASYQNYQGQKLVNRFNAYSYWYLTKAMDSHNVARNRVSLENALGRVKARSLIIAIASDILFPPEEQRFLSRHIPDASFAEVESLFGHDGFLIETEALSKIIKSFLIQQVTEKLTTPFRTA
ncbi:homoserine O-acetyltransferase family protein [Mucilaginibacter arboris]|uniref:Homoserine O-acetyltransferase n=1 Tax=Mucilaginibacter arboris TaxID=2682090 RepID=A0A7K1SXD7_9SPHI|nr:homoserine O-acetyltransferase [Mucilaginibacter arboris]MVN21995.1 homoserine O-acetyltransferase [Mucilaginibacter arboris]